MTKVKKVLGMMMAALLCFALTPTVAFANAGEMDSSVKKHGTITLTGAIEGQVYGAYQILELVSYDAENGTYAYKVPTDSLLSGESGIMGLKADNNEPYLVMIEGTNLVKWNDAAYPRDGEGNIILEDATEAQFAKAAYALCVQVGLQPTLPKSGVDNETHAAIGDTVTFENLPLGYYVIDSTVGTLCMLTTTNPNASVEEKNEEPSLSKQVREGDDDWGIENDANLGDTVSFRSTVTFAKGTQHYFFTDTMSGFDLVKKEDIVVRDNESDSVVDPSNTTYMLTKEPGFTVVNPGEQSFEIEFFDEYVNTMVGKSVTITYSAKLAAAANANVGTPLEPGPGNPNKAQLDYWTAPETFAKPIEKDTKTYTWQMPIFKFTDGEAKTALPGAEFKLYKQNDEQVLMTAIIVDGKVVGYNVDMDTGSDAPVVSAEDNGMIYINGLDSGIYKLVETKAPDGYNQMNDLTVEVKTIMTEGENPVINGVEFVYANKKQGQVEVENLTGSLLPSTGGMGTTILYIVGAVLVIGAVVFLVRRRSNATK